VAVASAWAAATPEERAAALEAGRRNTVAPHVSTSTEPGHGQKKRDGHQDEDENAADQEVVQAGRKDDDQGDHAGDHQDDEFTVEPHG